MHVCMHVNLHRLHTQFNGYKAYVAYFSCHRIFFCFMIDSQSCGSEQCMTGGVGVGSASVIGLIRVGVAPSSSGRSVSGERHGGQFSGWYSLVAGTPWRQ